MVFTPNLIIAGVAKCGTTTLHDLLACHPRVTGGIEKEVRFLMDREDPLCPPVNYHACGIEAWASQYRDGGTGDFDIWMDASPQYQYQSRAREVIATLDPQPFVLFITRDPVRRLFSLYQYGRYHHRKLPHITSFGDFIEEVREPVGAQTAKQRMMQSAWRDSQYDLMLEQWRAVMEPGKLRAITLEELNADREGTLVSLALWLGLEPYQLLNAQTDRSNPTIVTKSRFVRDVGAKVAKMLPENRAVRALKTRVREMNSAPVDHDEIDQNAPLMAALEAEFETSTARYERLREELSRTTC